MNFEAICYFVCLRFALKIGYRSSEFCLKIPRISVNSVESFKKTNFHPQKHFILPSLSSYRRRVSSGTHFLSSLKGQKTMIKLFGSKKIDFLMITIVNKDGGQFPLI